MDIENYTLGDLFRDYDFSGKIEGVDGFHRVDLAVDRYDSKTGLFMASGYLHNENEAKETLDSYMTGFFGRIIPGDDISSIIQMRQFFSPVGSVLDRNHTGVLAKLEDDISLITSYGGIGGDERYLLSLGIAGEREFAHTGFGGMDKALSVQLPSRK